MKRIFAQVLGIVFLVILWGITLFSYVNMRIAQRDYEAMDQRIQQLDENYKNLEARQDEWRAAELHMLQETRLRAREGHK